MQTKKKRIHAYLAAMVFPFLATGIAWMIEDILPRGNLSLLYLTAVLIVAVYSSTRPALLCALVSVVTYNFFFTEPRFTLFMMHQEDVLMVSFFLIMAAVTGRLAARLRDQLMVLETRENINRMQLELSRRLAGAMTRNDIFYALCSALNDVVCQRTITFDTQNALLAYTVDGKPLPNSDVNAIQYVYHANKPAGYFTEQYPDAHYYYAPLTDTRSVVAVIAMRFRDDKMPLSEKLTVVELLCQQASMTLHRLHLYMDLQRERVEKEQELLRSALLSSVSHDLRTPLASMIGATTSLLDLDESLSAAQKRELLETTLDESRRLDRYIQNLLDMTQLGHGDFRLVRALIAIEDIVSMVLKRIKPLLSERKINTDIQANLPLINVHGAMLEQAMFNILENAVKFSPEAAPIDIRIVYEKKVMIIDIVDQGSGIPEDEREQIFDMFYTVRRGDRHPVGTGLGLAITQSAIGVHGGRVAVVNTENSTGTTMRIYLPMTKQRSR